MNKILKIIGWCFAIAGALFIAVGIFFYKKDADFKNNSVETMGIITKIVSSYDSDGDSSHNVYVEFSVQGEKYSGEINYYSSGMYEGKDIVIYYNPDNPNDFRGEGATIGTLVFSIIGGVFLVVGIIFIAIVVRKNKKIKRVMSYNYRINATIINVSMNTSVMINGRHPYILESNCMSPADGKLYNFRSEDLWQDVTPILQQFNIKTIPVYVNPQNYAEYVVDVSQIKQYLGN
jgi:Protein of unknown function (DUF3592).